MDIKNNLEYKGFHAEVNYDIEENITYGCIANIEDYVSFEFKKGENAQTIFENAVDDYLEFCREVGKKRVKNCPGIATQCRGKIVMAEPHPRFTGAWRFELNGETWVCSSWAFEEGY